MAIGNQSNHDLDEYRKWQDQQPESAYRNRLFVIESAISRLVERVEMHGDAKLSNFQAGKIIGEYRALVDDLWMEARQVQQRSLEVQMDNESCRHEIKRMEDQINDLKKSEQSYAENQRQADRKNRMILALCSKYARHTISIYSAKGEWLGYWANVNNDTTFQTTLHWQNAKQFEFQVGFDPSCLGLNIDVWATELQRCVKDAVNYILKNAPSNDVFKLLNISTVHKLHGDYPLMEEIYICVDQADRHPDLYWAIGPYSNNFKLNRVAVDNATSTLSAFKPKEENYGKTICINKNSEIQKRISSLSYKIDQTMPKAVAARKRARKTQSSVKNKGRRLIKGTTITN